MSDITDGDTVYADAWRVIQDHAAGHPCPQCTTVGCDRLTGAHDTMERLDEDRDWYGDRLLGIRALIRDAEAGRPPVVSATAVRGGRADSAGRRQIRGVA